MSLQNIKNIAVVLAGGVGKRLGLSIPKQFVRLAGKPIMLHTLEAFENEPLIDEVYLVMHRESIPKAEEIIKDAGLKKVVKVLPGGKERKDSTKAALDAIEYEEANVLIHDAVRPFVNHDIIERCLDALKTYSAADVTIPSADTIVKVDNNGIITDIPDRNYLLRGQTPQAFKLSAIRRAYEVAEKVSEITGSPIHVTDDCGIVYRYLRDVPIKTVDGEEDNIKITKSFDVQVADKIIQFKAKKNNNFDLIYDSVDEKHLITNGKYGEVHSDKQLLQYIEDKVRDNVFVVFGGNSGIGKTLINILNSFGAKCISFDLHSEELPVDVTKAEDVEKAYKFAEEKFGKIDCVVVTAGILTIKEVKDMTEKDMKGLIDVNLLGPALCAKYAYPYLKKTKGQIVFFTSSSHTRGRASYSLYSASKAGVVNFTQALCDEWVVDGIRANAINPQRTATPMRYRAFGDEPPETLLTAEKVACYTLGAIISDFSGEVVDVTVV